MSDPPVPSDTDHHNHDRVPGDAPRPDLLHPGLRGPLGPGGPAAQLGDQQAVLHPGAQDGQADPQGLSQLPSLEGELSLFEQEDYITII